MFRLLALSLPLWLVLVIEVGLRLGGAGYSASFLVASKTDAGVLTDNYKFAWRFFPKALARVPQPIVVAADKPRDTFRVIVFGGSAAMGDPEPAYGLPRVLEALLRSRYPQRRIEVVNAAVTAVNSHVVLPIARDCLCLDADVWIVYLGNNEVHGPFGAGTVFGGRDTPLWLNRSGLALQRTRLGQFAFGLTGVRKEAASPENWRGLEMFLQHQIRHDDPGLERVYANFRRNLEDIFDLAPRSTTVITSTLLTNLKDFPPFVSLHRHGMAKSDLEKWELLYDRGCRAQAESDYQSALGFFEQAIEIDPDFAELQFRLGKCYSQLGSSDEALSAFRRARDLDALRFRADSTINDIIRSVANGRSNVRLVDAEQAISVQVPAGILGDELLHEHVHLNFKGNYRLARLIAEGLANSPGSAQQAGLAAASWLSPEACRQQLGLTLYHELQIVREMQGRLNEPPFSGQMDHDQRDARLALQIRELSASMTSELRQEALAEYQQLVAERPEDWVLRKQFALLLESMGDLDGAIEQFTAITARLSHHAESLFRLGALFNRVKQWTEAEQALRQALGLRPDFARAANSLGICLSHQQRFQESYHQFRQATRLQPSFAEAFYNWGLVLANQRDLAAAREKYKEAVSANSNYVPPHVKLGRFHIEEENYAAALPHYREVARLRPHDATAQLNLGLLYLTMNKPAAATNQLRYTLDIDPGNQHAVRALRQLGESEEDRRLVQ